MCKTVDQEWQTWLGIEARMWVSEADHVRIDCVSQVYLLVARLVRFFNAEQWQKVALILSLMLNAEYALDGATLLGHLGPTLLSVSIGNADAANWLASQCSYLSSALLIRFDTS
jgi:hypothetical protein